MIKYVYLGFASVFFTNPFWVINTRLKLQHVKFKEDDNQKTKYSGIYGKCESFSKNKLCVYIHVIICINVYVNPI